MQYKIVDVNAAGLVTVGDMKCICVIYVNCTVTTKSSACKAWSRFCPLSVGPRELL